MRVRITGGQFGGRFIKTLPSLRPTSDLVRKAVFDILSDAVIDSSFLELYAGSGAVGIEALSRGAARVLMIEKDHQHYQLIKDNLRDLESRLTDNHRSQRDPHRRWRDPAKCGDVKGGGAAVRQMPVEDFLAVNQSSYDIVYADPWYEDDLSIIGWEKLLAPDGLLVLEHSVLKEAPQNPALKVLNHKRYGDTALTFYIRA